MASLVEDLRQATRDLAAADFDDRQQLELALVRRGEAVTRFAEAIRLDAGASVSEETAKELRAIVEVGTQLFLRLTLMKAAAQVELKHLECEQQWLAGLAATLPQPDSQLDIRG